MLWCQVHRISGGRLTVDKKNKGGIIESMQGRSKAYKEQYARVCVCRGCVED